MQGLEMAYRIACREDGENSRTAHALAKEMRFRRRCGVAPVRTMKELSKDSDGIKRITIQTVLAMSMLILWEQFGFGHKRLLRFKEEFDTHADALVLNQIDWLDVLEGLNAEAGIDLVLPKELLRG